MQKAQIQVDWKYPRPVLDWFATLEYLTTCGHIPIPENKDVGIDNQ